MAFKRKYLIGKDIIDRHDTNISSLDGRVTKLEAFNGLAKSTVYAYVCPKDAIYSHTYDGNGNKLVGSDVEGTGSIDHPFATVQKAINYLQGFRAVAPIVFYIRMHAGIYNMSFTEARTATGYQMVTGGGAAGQWMFRHCDTVTGSGCYFVVEGYEWRGHVEEAPTDTTDTRYNDFDKEHVLVYAEDDGIDGYNDAYKVHVVDASGSDSHVSRKANGDVVLKNPVIVQIKSKYVGPGAYAPYAAFTPLYIRNVTFRCEPGYGAITGGWSNMWPIHQYAGDSMSFKYCKFMNWPLQCIRPRNPGLTGKNVSGWIECCYFDNEEIYLGQHEMAAGTTLGTAIDPRTSDSSAAFYVENCRFRYFNTAIGTNAANVFFQLNYTPSSLYIDGVLKSVYRRNVLTFDECRAGINVHSMEAIGWNNNGTFVDDIPARNTRFRFTNNTVPLTAKAYVNGTRYV